jgi:dipeptidyl aminopeptidase/acylaminoacyl peptidase
MHDRPVSHALRRTAWLAGCLLALAAAPALADVNVNGRIAYTVCDYSTGEYQCDIWTMDADGANAVNITNSPTESETGPVWSPDGTKIAFSRGDDYLQALWAMAADGTAQVQLTEPGWLFGPSWSPGGTKLAYVNNVPGVFITSQFDIFVHDLDTGTGVNLTNSDYDELEPAWSPDGGLIAFAAVRPTWDGWGAWDIVTVDPTGANEQNITAPPGRFQEDRAPSWSPDGSMLVFMSQWNESCCEPWEIWGVNRDGSGLTNLTQHPRDDMFPNWSPDGTEILFSSNRESDFGLDIYSMPAPTVLPPEAAPARKRPAPPPVRRLTRSGAASHADWGAEEHDIDDPFGLYVVVKGEGKVVSSPAGVACGKDCSEVYANGTEVTLKAKPKTGQRFAGWSGACSGSKKTCTVKLDDVTAVGATFKPER